MAMPNVLTRAAAEFARDPAMMAWALAGWRARHRAAADDLAAHLACTADDLLRLALCRRPDPRDAQFSAHCARLAVYCHCALPSLVLLLEETAPS